MSSMSSMPVVRSKGERLALCIWVPLGGKPDGGRWERGVDDTGSGQRVTRRPKRQGEGDVSRLRLPSGGLCAGRDERMCMRHGSSRASRERACACGQLPRATAEQLLAVRAWRGPRGLQPLLAEPRDSVAAARPAAGACTAGRGCYGANVAEGGKGRLRWAGNTGRMHSGQTAEGRVAAFACMCCAALWRPLAVPGARPPATDGRAA
ncbi:MAG: hypothetical protein J3K34DRAFT_415220 [Monoraphidium minutum]|nr:MAG: hypothetical protein J3K34DRAFT_415220 [Monoraphidium minutum]